MLSRRSLLVAPAAVLLSASGLSAQPSNLVAQSPNSATVETRIGVAAIVESVDHATRDVLLRGPAGQLLTVRAGPEVRNLAQVRAGDRVLVGYFEGLAVKLSPPGSTAAPPTVDGAVARAAAGQRPGLEGLGVVRMRVRVDAVDRASHAVTFTPPGRPSRTVAVQAPQMRQFVSRLRPGDEVDIEYVEAVAVSVERMPN